MGFYRFVLIWVTFSAYTGYIIALAANKTLDKRTPRRVYGWFSIVYKTGYTLAITGYVISMLDFIGVGGLIFGQQVAILLVFYGVYYGVLGRDCAGMSSLLVVLLLARICSRCSLFSII